MSSSYYDTHIKTSPSSLFHNVQNTNEFAVHQPTRIGNHIYNFRQQALIQSYPRTILISPQTQNMYPFQSGSSIEYKIPMFTGLINQFYLSLEIKNENQTEDLKLPSNLINLINKISVNKNTTDEQNVNGEMLKFHNLFDITYENNEIKHELLGINEDQTEHVLKPNETKKLLIRLHNCMSGTHLFRSKIYGDLIIKIDLKPGIVSSGNVSNTEVKLTKQELYLQYTEITDKQTQYFNKINQLDYYANELVHQQYQLSNVQSMSTNTIDLKSYNRTSAAMLVYVTKQNEQLSQLENKYDIDSIQFLDSQNNNLINNISINQQLNKLNMLEHFTKNKYLHKNANKIFLIPFVLDVQKCIQDNAITGSAYKQADQDFKLQIKMKDDIPQDLFVNVIFVSYGFLRLHDGQFNLIKGDK